MVDLNKGATVELVKTLSDDIRRKSDGSRAPSAGEAVRQQFNRTLMSATTHVADLNELTATGMYSSVQNTENVPNGETKNFYNVFVIADVSNPNRVTQIYINLLNNNIYIRQRNTQATWEDWACVAKGQSSNLYMALSETDLNNVTDTGYYFCPGSKTVTNAPDDYYGNTIFLLTVYKDVNNSNRVYQSIYCSANGNRYTRNKTTNGVWTSWHSPKDGCVYIQPINSTSWRIYFGKYNTRLYHVVDANSNSDLWNILSIQHGTNALCSAGTDILGPIREKGQPDFMGGVHGDEIVNSVLLKADGKPTSLDSEIYCNNFTLEFESTLYRPSDGTPVIRRNLKAIITLNQIEVTSAFTVLADTISIDRATNGGLIAMSNDHLTAVAMNNKLYSAAPTVNTENTSKANVDCTLYSSDGYFRIENLIGHELETYGGFLQTYSGETPIRNKIYFNTVEVPAGKTFNQGDTIVGKFRYTFN